MGSPRDIAYTRAGEVFEAQRKRGEPLYRAMAYALRIIRANTAHQVVFRARRTDVPREAIVTATEVALRHGLSLHALRVKSRENIPVTEEVAWSLRQLSPPVSYPLIGAILGRDHSTIHTAVKRFEKRMATDEVLRARVGRTTERRAA